MLFRSDDLVSMPHAALWVVQLERIIVRTRSKFGFNAARGFVGGAARSVVILHDWSPGFNAARGFVGGAAKREVG